MYKEKRHLKIIDLYRCLCVPGVMGINCEINYCLANPCVHGQCFNEINGNGHGLRTLNEAFFIEIPNFWGLGRQFGQISFWSIWGIFGRFISTHFGTVSPLYMFSIIQPLFHCIIIFTKTKP